MKLNLTQFFSTKVLGGFGSALLLAGFLQAQNTQPNLNAGLVASYPFNGNANDESGNRRNGTVNGATATTDRFGAAGKAYAFNGRAYIATTFGFDSTGTRPGLPNFARTISLWFNTDSVQSAEKVFVFSYGGAGQCGTSYEQAINTNLRSLTAPRTFEAQKGCNLSVNAAGPSANTNTLSGWHHWVVSITADSIPKINQYLDGTLFSSANYTGGSYTSVPFNGTLFIGSAINADGLTNTAVAGTVAPNKFTGKLDDVRLYNRALSATEVLALKNLTPNCTTPATPRITYSGSTRITCAGGTVSLSAPAGYNSYLWSNGATTSQINVNTAGTYSVKVFSGNCSSASSAAVTVTTALTTPAITASTSLANGIATACYGTSVTFSAPAGYTGYAWIKDSTFLGRSRTFTATTAGTYKLIAYNGACTTAAASVKLVYQAGPPTPAITGVSNTPICPGVTTATLSAPAGYAYLWSTGATGQSITVRQAGTYFVTVYNYNTACGTRSSPVTITARPCRLSADNNDLAEASEISFYPNPASSEVFVNGLANGAEVSIFNSLGQLVKNLVYEKGNSIKISDLAQGLYFVKTENHITRLMVK